MHPTLAFLLLCSLFITAHAASAAAASAFDGADSPLKRERWSAAMKPINRIVGLAMPWFFVITIGISFLLEHLYNKAANRKAMKDQLYAQKKAQAELNQIFNDPAYKAQTDAQATSDKTGRDVLYSMIENSQVVPNDTSIVSNRTQLYEYEDLSSQLAGTKQKDYNTTASS